SNFPALSGLGAHRIGFDVAVNDVDRFVPAQDDPTRREPFPATYLSWNGKGELYQRPSRFGVLDLPARAASRPLPLSSQRRGTAGLLLAVLAAAALVALLTRWGSGRLARTGPRPKAALLPLDALLAGFLALASGCHARTAKEEASRRLDAA